MTITKEGYPFIMAALVPALLFCAWLGWAGLWAFAPAVFAAWFFRLPSREVPDGDVVVSPADGRVVEISTEERDGGKFTRVGIFMSIFNVHVNFAPAPGRVVSAEHTAGKFLPANRPKVSDLNEHFDMELDCGGWTLGVRQIAGLIARRIVNYARPGAEYGRGDKFGLIRFGSRVDVVVPEDRVKVCVRLGQKVSGRSTVIGTML